MSHMIFEDRFIERANRKPAWHGIARKVYGADEQPTLREAFVECGAADFQIVLEPAVLSYQGQPVDTGRVAVLRTPTQDDPQPRFFGMASDHWLPIQNVGTDEQPGLSEIFQPAANYFPIETAGVLDQGERFFFTLKDERYDVKVNGKADTVEEYVLILDHKTPGRALSVSSVSIRVVCNNTLILALAGAKFTLPIPHTDGAVEIAGFVSEALAKMGSARAAVRQAYNMMAATPLSQAQAKDVFKAAWPEPKPTKAAVFVNTVSQSSPLEVNFAALNEAKQVAMRDGMAEIYAKANERSEYTAQRNAELRETAMVSLMNMADSEGLGINGWTALNAVVETEEYRCKARGNVQVDMIGGDRARNIDRATRYLWDEVIGVKAGRN